MHNTIRKTVLVAAVAALCLTAAFPAHAEEVSHPDIAAAKDEAAGKDGIPAEAVGRDVTVVENETPDKETEQSSGQDGTVTGASHKARAGRGSEEGYVDAGPGAEKKEETPVSTETSLGRFTITGYCGCDKCSNGHGLTYSGTIPTPNHTISADLALFPLGTRLKIDGIVYTVEDKGSSVKGNILDIFYSSHEDALAKGTYTAEVFLVED